MFEVNSRFDDGYETSVLYECENIKNAYKTAISDSKRDAWKYNAISDVNVFVAGDYKNTVKCVFSCGLFGYIYW